MRSWAHYMWWRALLTQGTQNKMLIADYCLEERRVRPSSHGLKSRGFVLYVIGYNNYSWRPYNRPPKNLGVANPQDWRLWRTQHWSDLHKENSYFGCSLMEPHQTRTVVLHSKVPLLASPTSAVEMTNPKYPSLLQTTASHKPSLFSRDFVEPPNKILRLDASGSFHVEFTGHKHKGSNAASYGSSSSSRLTSLMDLWWVILSSWGFLHQFIKLFLCLYCFFGFKNHNSLLLLSSLL